MGMNPEPMQEYSIASRCVCDKCGSTPQIKSVSGEDPYRITASCCGKTETKTVQRRELTFLQRFFVEKAGD